MGHVYHQLYYHLVWGTHLREPLIRRSWRPQLLEVISEEVLNRGGYPIRRNAMPDHVHLLARLPPTVAVSQFLGAVKGAAAFRANREFESIGRLVWQEGYGAVTIRKGEIDTVARYIDRQEEHHRSGHLSEALESLDCVVDDWPAASP